MTNSRSSADAVRAPGRRVALKWLCFAGAFGFALFAVERHTAYLEKFLADAISPPPQRLAAALEHFEHKPVQARTLMEADAYFWIEFAIRSASANELRLRWSEADNTPEGRPIWWNSGLPLFARGLAWVKSRISGEPLIDAIRSVAPYGNVVLFALALAGFGVWIGRRWGVASACVMVALLSVLPRIVWDFAYTRFDHHGQHVIALVGAALALASGAGAEPRQRRVSFAIAGIFSGAGLWVGATQQLFVAFLFVLGGAIEILARPRGDAQTGESLPWRTWGISAAATSLAFFLFENAPDRLWQTRFEVNHPMHAALILSAGMALAELEGIRRRARLDWAASGRVALCCVAPAVFVITLWIGGSAVHVLRDPVMKRAHEVIIEFRSFAEVYPKDTIRNFFEQIGVIFFVAPIAAVLGFSRGTPPPVARALRLLAPAAVALPVVTILQARWSGLASAICAVALVPILAGGLWVRRGRKLHLAAVLQAAAIVLVLACFVGWGFELGRRSKSEEGFAYSSRGAAMTEVRDLALNLRLLATQGPVRVLADPNLTPSLVGFAKVPAVASYYWENAEGLKAAAAAFAAELDSDALAIVKRRGITHVLVPGEPGFAAAMFWIAKGISDPKAISQSLAARLVSQRDVPPWLEPMSYYANLRPAVEPWKLYRVVEPRAERVPPQP